MAWEEYIKQAKISDQNFAKNLIEAFWQGDLMTAKILLKQWYSSYNTATTGPLNNFKKMYHGIWPEMDNDRWYSSGTNIGSDGHTCTYRETILEYFPIQEDTYCDKYKCILRNSCDAYTTSYSPKEYKENNEVSESALNSGRPIEPLDENNLEAELTEMYNNVATINIGVNNDR